MNLKESIGYKTTQRRVATWWASKSKDEQIEIETHCAIAARALGSTLGAFLVFTIL